MKEDLLYTEITNLSLTQDLLKTKPEIKAFFHSLFIKWFQGANGEGQWE